MTKISPVLLNLARTRVERGVAWLDARAKRDTRFAGWRLQTISIHNGCITSYVRLEYNTNDPLSLALKEVPDLADPSDGRVKWTTTARAFGFSSSLGQKKALYLGLWEGGQDHHSGAGMDYCQALNAAWSEALGEYCTSIAPRHYLSRKAA